MSRSGGYKCYNLYCKNCIGKSLCGEPGDTALSCIDRIVLQEYKKEEIMDYKKLAADLLSGCEENCADCEYAGDSEFECTIAQLAATAITDLLARAEAAEARVEKAENIASDLCDDFTDFVTGGIHNAAPYCENFRSECVNARGWCNGNNKVCRGFLPKAAVWKEE